MRVNRNGNIDGYDGYMDAECIDLCNALNEVDGITTTESCCGHYINAYHIWMYATSAYAISVLARAVDRRYLVSNQLWKIEVETVETPESSPVMFILDLHSEAPYADEKSMEDDCNSIIASLNYWASDKYKEYFEHGDQ